MTIFWNRVIGRIIIPSFYWWGNWSSERFKYLFNSMLFPSVLWVHITIAVQYSPWELFRATPTYKQKFKVHNIHVSFALFLNIWLKENIRNFLIWVKRHFFLSFFLLGNVNFKVNLKISYILSKQPKCNYLYCTTLNKKCRLQNSGEENHLK